MEKNIILKGGLMFDKFERLSIWLEIYMGDARRRKAYKIIEVDFNNDGIFSLIDFCCGRLMEDPDYQKLAKGIMKCIEDY
jgi:hypothetical protein